MKGFFVTAQVYSDPGCRIPIHNRSLNKETVVAFTGPATF